MKDYDFKVNGISLGGGEFDPEYVHTSIGQGGKDGCGLDIRIHPQGIWDFAEPFNPTEMHHPPVTMSTGGKVVYLDTDDIKEIIDTLQSVLDAVRAGDEKLEKAE